jgi:hypothetical protein
LDVCQLEQERRNRSSVLSSLTEGDSAKQ